MQSSKNKKINHLARKQSTLQLAVTSLATLIHRKVSVDGSSSAILFLSEHYT